MKKEIKFLLGGIGVATLISGAIAIYKKHKASKQSPSVKNRDEMIDKALKKADWVSEQAFMDQYRCKCGRFKGKQFEGEICPFCISEITKISKEPLNEGDLSYYKDHLSGRSSMFTSHLNRKLAEKDSVNTTMHKLDSEKVKEDGSVPIGYKPSRIMVDFRGMDTIGKTRADSDKKSIFAAPYLAFKNRLHLFQKFMERLGEIKINANTVKTEPQNISVEDVCTRLAFKSDEYYFLIEAHEWDDDDNVVYFYEVLIFDYGHARYVSVDGGQIDWPKDGGTIRDFADDVESDFFADEVPRKKIMLDAEVLNDIWVRDENDACDEYMNNQAKYMELLEREKEEDGKYTKILPSLYKAQSVYHMRGFLGIMREYPNYHMLFNYPGIPIAVKIGNLYIVTVRDAEYYKYTDLNLFYTLFFDFDYGHAKYRLLFIDQCIRAKCLDTIGAMRSSVRAYLQITEDTDVLKEDLEVIDWHAFIKIASKDLDKMKMDSTLEHAINLLL